jgi:beta-phosphoglucomutase
MRKFRAVVFDFNGTVVWDTPLHNLAWDNFFKKHKIQLNDSEKHTHLHGKTNRKILEFVFQRPIDDNELQILAEQKESIYRKLCVEHGLKLADGVVELLNYCVGKSIPIAIATSSGKENVDFFFEYFSLEKWFKMKNIIFSDGVTKSKPDPEIFLKAFSILKTEARDTLVFEDSISGIKAAENAKSGKIIVVNSNNETYPNIKHTIIDSFREFDYSMI